MATVDLRGLSGGEPLRKTQEALSNLPSGSPVQVVGDDAENARIIKELLSEKGILYQEFKVDNSDWVLYFNIPVKP